MNHLIQYYKTLLFVQISTSGQILTRVKMIYNIHSYCNLKKINQTYFFLAKMFVIIPWRSSLKIVNQVYFLLMIMAFIAILTKIVIDMFQLNFITSAIMLVFSNLGIMIVLFKSNFINRDDWLVILESIQNDKNSYLRIPWEKIILILYYVYTKCILVKPEFFQLLSLEEYISLFITLLSGHIALIYKSVLRYLNKCISDIPLRKLNENETIKIINKVEISYCNLLKDIDSYNVFFAYNFLWNHFLLILKLMNHIHLVFQVLAHPEEPKTMLIIVAVCHSIAVKWVRHYIIHYFKSIYPIIVILIKIIIIIIITAPY